MGSHLRLLNNRKSNRISQNMFSYLHDHLTHLFSDQYNQKRTES
jgi:hypothetical protein